MVPDQFPVRPASPPSPAAHANAAAVSSHDNEMQMIVAAEVTQEPSDIQQLLPVLDAAIENVGSEPKSLLADAGYLSEDNLEGLDERAVEGYLAIGRKTKDPGNHVNWVAGGDSGYELTLPLPSVGT